MPISLVIAVAVLIIITAFLFFQTQRQHVHGINAPEQKIAITILDKQIIATSEPTDDDEYWIYVQKGSFGIKREFQVGVHYYHHLTPGDKGILTYQGDKFLHFSLSH